MFFSNENGVIPLCNNIAIKAMKQHSEHTLQCLRNFNQFFFFFLARNSSVKKQPGAKLNNVTLRD